MNYDKSDNYKFIYERIYANIYYFLDSIRD